MRRSFALLAEVMYVGVMVCVASLPIVTAWAAAAAGASSLRSLTDSDVTPTIKTFLRSYGAALRSPVVLSGPPLVVGVGLLDALALLSGLPGAHLIGPVAGLGLAALVVVGLRAAVLWRPGSSWPSVVVSAARLSRSDIGGSVMLAAAIVVAILIGTKVVGFLVALPGLLLLAAIAVTRRSPE
jgi:hypothetical protein